MPKPEVGTPKWISNQERKKGKTKIRWFCGLCGVACKDENGFKCHLQSEKHITNESTVATSKKRGRMYVDDFSKAFCRKFLDFMVVEHLNHQVLAHDAYIEWMKDFDEGRGDRRMKQMARTSWGTLGNFVAYMRDRGKIDAQKGIKGWMLMVSEDMLDSDGSVNSADDAPQASLVPPNKKTRWDQVPQPPTGLPSQCAGQIDGGGPVDDEEDHQLELAAAAAEAAALAGIVPVVSEATDRLSDEKVAFSMSGGLFKKPAPPAPKPPPAPAPQPAAKPKPVEKSKPSGGTWLKKHMVVKVVGKSSEWYKKKVRVVAVDSAHQLARVQQIVQEGEPESPCLDLPEQQLETVIPLAGKAVIVCGGEHKGKRGTLDAIDEAKFCVSVKLRDTGDVVKGLPYESVCKYNPYT